MTDAPDGAVVPRLTCHVLDLTRGLPAVGLGLHLARLSSPAGVLVTTVTNADGRTDEPLLTGDDLQPGRYELAFAVGGHFAETAADGPAAIPFLDVVPIHFGVSPGVGHLHVALLVTPWSYTTYRGKLMAGPRLTVDEVDALDEEDFVTTFGHVYEDTPALAAAAGRRRPFGDRATLVAAFHAVAGELDDTAVLALLRAHPRLAAAGPMTASSSDEQRSAGLTTVDERTRAGIAAGNARYVERFGFPFIIAVRGLQPADIAAALAERLDHDEPGERATAFREVLRIAELRLAHIVAP